MKMTFENFYAGNTYKGAVAMAQRIATAPCGNNSPLIWGGQYGVGKTHLLSAIETEVKVQYPCFEVIHTSAQTLIAEYAKN